MQLIPLKSPRVHSGNELLSVLVQALGQNDSSLESGDILIVASKVVAYCQGLLKKFESPEAFRELIRSEADQVLDEGDMILTMKNHILIPNAGIDNSNTPEGEVVPWPENPFAAAEELRKALMDHYKLDQLGIVVSDSHCQPLRAGTSGIAIGWAGFEGVQDERGAKDLFDREMVYTKIAIADNLASAATLLMGETDASIPFVIVRDFEAKFTKEKSKEADYFVAPEDCLYKPLYVQKMM